MGCRAAWAASQSQAQPGFPLTQHGMQAKGEQEIKRLADYVCLSKAITDEAAHLLQTQVLRPCVVRDRMPVDLAAGEAFQCLLQPMTSSTWE